MSAFGTPKKAPRTMRKLTDEMLQGYRDNDTSELHRYVKAGYRFDGSNTTITDLRLSCKGITDVSTLAQVLPQTQVTVLNLFSNLITDVSALAQVLPQTQIADLVLEHNQIADVSGLVQVLPQTRITELWLEENQISDADKAEIRAVKKNKDGEDICTWI